VGLAQIGVERWQHDLWIKIIEAALNGHADQVSLDYHPAFNHPAASRYGATSPRLLKWFDQWNEPRSYADQVKPFNFLISFQAKNGVWSDFVVSTADQLPGRGRPKKASNYAPVAPYEKNALKAAQQAFDRETGEAICPDQLKTYAECLAQYHISSEVKFVNGEFLNCGPTTRRHVVADSVRLIGKEGNRVEEDGLRDRIDQAHGYEKRFIICCPSVLPIG
jgi:hypothetical protein